MVNVQHPSISLDTICMVGKIPKKENDGGDRPVEVVVVVVQRFHPYTILHHVDLNASLKRYLYCLIGLMTGISPNNWD